ncbi:L-lactate permease [Kocuria rhizophila]|uniref:L-lactate permease n=1 Tax=Kocuria rhizophila TaxID=72000 RepID=UPI000EAC2E3F|nr:L-lactate permease [Kocuria rhizophila]
MWTQSLDTLGSLPLTALVAAIPIVVFLACMMIFKLTGLKSGVIALVVQVLVALFVFHMPVTAVAGAGLLGLLTALWPIAYIIVMAVWLYRLSVRSGRFDIIRSSIAGVSADQRIQVLLIAFAFGAFLEGVAGFGVPIAICAALLVQLGFPPVRAAVLCLVANVAAGAYGAIGVPVLVGAQVTGMEVQDLSRAMVILLQPLTFLVPFLLVWMVDGLRGLRETWLPALVSSAVFCLVQGGLLWFMGPELADLAAGLLAMVSLFALCHVWSPRRVSRAPEAPETAEASHPASEVIRAWSPFYILTGVILVWSIPAVQHLFTKGALGFTTLKVPMPGLTGHVTTAAGTVVNATWTFSILGATGTAILIAVLITFFTTPQLHVKELVEELRGALKALGPAIVLIAVILMLANIANYSGGSTAMGTALAAAGPIFPLFAPIIGWIGVFLTGSVVNNNTLFAPLQVATAEGIGASPALLVGTNTAGGTTAKVISPQSIAIAAGAVGLNGREAEIMRGSLMYSLGMLAVMCVWTFVLTMV